MVADFCWSRWYVLRSTRREADSGLTPGEGIVLWRDVHQNHRHVVWNPLRDRLPETAALKFLTGLKANRCSADRTVCQDALPNHRVSAWQLAYREDEAEIVSLYFKLAKYGEESSTTDGRWSRQCPQGDAGWTSSATIPTSESPGGSDFRKRRSQPLLQTTVGNNLDCVTLRITSRWAYKPKMP